MFQRKNKKNTSGEDINEMEGNNLPNKEFEVMVIKMLTVLRRKMDEHSEILNKETKYNKVSNKSYRTEEY